LDDDDGSNNGGYKNSETSDAFENSVRFDKFVVAAFINL